jgi:hypothetical protein
VAGQHASGSARVLRTCQANGKWGRGLASHSRKAAEDPDLTLIGSYATCIAFKLIQLHKHAVQDIDMQYLHEESPSSSSKHELAGFLPDPARCKPWTALVFINVYV